MAKTFGMLFGIVFLAVGILGFVPGVTKDEMLLGIFHVNTVHSVVHIVSGAIFLFASMAGALILARAVTDQALSDHILKATTRWIESRVKSRTPGRTRPQ